MSPRRDERRADELAAAAGGDGAPAVGGDRGAEACPGPPTGDASAADRHGRLVVCATPIGNLDDVTTRVLRALADVDVVACEDTRHTRRLLDRYGIRVATVSLHEHNESARAPELLERVRGGDRVAVVSDAGMPVVSDPGGRLVAAARDAGLPVEVLPGPSAPVTAIATAGIPADRWRFVGFLPRRADELLALLRDPDVTVAFESPKRLVAALRAIAGEDPARVVAVCRELTKLHEEVVRGRADDVAERFAAGGVRGEVTLVVAGIEAAVVDENGLGRAVDAARRLVEDGARARTASRVVAELSGVGANDIYRALHATD